MAKQDPRKVFEKAFLEIGKENPRVVGVSCDSAKGAGMWSFVEAFPSVMLKPVFLNRTPSASRRDFPSRDSSRSWSPSTRSSPCAA